MVQLTIFSTHNVMLLSFQSGIKGKIDISI